MNSNDGAVLTVVTARALLAAGFAALEERKQEINDLNVYPVPDGDTGTNLALTMRGILDAVELLPVEASTEELGVTITQAALMGARGNSGVILSQMIRGAMEVLGQSVPVTTERLAEAFRNATDTAYRAVRKPVEGTMLTVLRDMAEAAAEAASSLELKPFMDQVIGVGWKSVERTPSLLRVLAEAGVVDAGGYGLVVLIEGATKGAADWETPIATRLSEAPAAVGFRYENEGTQEQSEYTYCTSFLLSGYALDSAALEEELGRLGNSLLVVGDSNKIKVHVHTDDPGQVLSLATRRGSLAEIEIDNMKEQTSARAERLTQVATAELGSALTDVVAVVVGAGNKALFRSLGVDLIVDGGQSMNPSAEDLMRCVDRASAPSIVILPNNRNVIMTAEQIANLVGQEAGPGGREVYVVPTRSIQAGLVAAVAYDKRNPGRVNAEEMEAALGHVVTGAITRAVRDATLEDVQMHRGDYIGLVDERIVAASSDMGPVVEDTVRRMLEGGRETLTVLVGSGEGAQQAAGLVERASKHFPSAELEVHEGGQPHYLLLLAAE